MEEDADNVDSKQQLKQGKKDKSVRNSSKVSSPEARKEEPVTARLG